MADDGFNGSVIDFQSITLGPLRSINFRESAARVDTTGAGDSEGTEEVGVPKKELAVTFVGGLPASGGDVGDKGALSVVWNDGGNPGTIPNVVVADRNQGGSMDTEVISEMTFLPSSAP
jgi:hypothetical protein